MKKKPIPYGEDYKLVPNTVGVIVDSIWIKKDGSIMKVRLTTGKTLSHEPKE